MVEEKGICTGIDMIKQIVSNGRGRHDKTMVYDPDNKIKLPQHLLGSIGIDFPLDNVQELKDALEKDKYVVCNVEGYTEEQLIETLKLLYELMKSN